MPSLRETKNRIRSVKNTEKITRAMKMVAASKLKRAQDAVVKPRAFSKKLLEIVSLLAAKGEASPDEVHPLLADRPKKKRVVVLVLSSDRGLCGALNSSVVRMTQRFIVDHEEDIPDITISTIGRKGAEGLNRLGIAIEKRYEASPNGYDFAMARRIAQELCQRFLSHEIDGVYLVYNVFRSAIAQEAVAEQLLPVERAFPHRDLTVDFIYEPDRDALLTELVPRHFASRLFQSFLESYASEQGARMTAMDNATRNAKEMTEKLTLEYNRVRQAAITKELMEIISGAEAL